MKKDYLKAGKIVGTHGVKGMLRIQPWADSGEFLKGFKKFYLESGNSSFEVERLQPHGNIVIAQFKGVESIESAESLRGKIIYIKRSDAKLPKDRYFVDELIGCNVFDADSGLSLGKLTDISVTGANDVWHIEKGGKEFLVPAIDDVIVSVDIDNENIVLRPLKGIFDDED